MAIADPYPWPTVDAETCLMLVGDINVQDRAEPASAFRHVRRSLEEADVRYGNLETCLHRREVVDITKVADWYHAETRMVEALTAAGFDAVGGANNVTYGEEAIRSTVEVLDEAGIAHCGLGATRRAARAPAVVTAGDTSVGFLQYTARYYGPEQVATGDSPGVAAFDPDEPGAIETIATDVEALAAEADIVVVSHHTRQSSTTEVEPYQRTLARAVIDAGADLVFGHGAHRNQPIERYERTPIFHCIGQFAFDWPAKREDRDGLLLRVHFDGDELARVGFVPVYRDDDNDVYLASPDAIEGRRQLEALRERSPDVSFTVEDGEAVLSLDAP